MIDVSHIKPAALLAALYNNASPQGFGYFQNNNEPMTEAQAEALIGGRSRVSFDYIEGRSVKIDINGKSLDPWLYDRDNGQGAAARVVASIKP